MYTGEKKKLGAGIITISIIDLLIYVFLLFVFATLLSPSFVEIMVSQGVVIPFSKAEVLVNLAFCSFTIIGLILILCKKSIGIYIYFVTFIVQLIFTIIMYGFSIGNLFSLVLPVLMGIFIYLRRNVFGFGEKHF